MAGHRCRCGLGLAQGEWRARLGSLVLLSALLAGPVQAATFTVDSTGDGDAVAPINDGICDADATAAVVCTLRAALTEAINFGGPTPSPSRSSRAACRRSPPAPRSLTSRPR